MLIETAKGRRRLYREGDPIKPGRKGKITPNPNEIPEKYRNLLDWYANWGKASSPQKNPVDPLLKLKGSGRNIWKDEHADDYVNRLRAGWG